VAEEASVIYRHRCIQAEMRETGEKKGEEEKGKKTFFIVCVRMQHLAVADRIVDVLDY